MAQTEITVTGCGDCPMSAILSGDTVEYEVCNHPDNQDFHLFATCPLKQQSLTIKLKENADSSNESY